MVAFGFEECRPNLRNFDERANSAKQRQYRALAATGGKRDIVVDRLTGLFKIFLRPPPGPSAGIGGCASGI